MKILDFIFIFPTYKYKEVNYVSVKSYNRNFEALGYKELDKTTMQQKQTKLTEKQYLVYSYLMSISIWNAEKKEDHYYVYKNSFKVKDACELIHISQPTWRTAIKKLDQLGYIVNTDKWYEIYFPERYVPLNLGIITYLLPYGASIKCGGHIIAVYSVIAQYWKYQTNKGEVCEITENQLRKVFKSRTKHSDDADLITYELMIKVFQSSNLMNIQETSKVYKGKSYTPYIIKYVSTETLPKNLKDNSNAPDDIEEILKAIGKENSLEMNIE